MAGRWLLDWISLSQVSDQDIAEMFSAADTDQDGRIRFVRRPESCYHWPLIRTNPSWSEFQAMARIPDTGGVWASSPSSSSSAPAPLTLSVCELARRAPRDISETHMMAGWEKIGGITLVRLRLTRRYICNHGNSFRIGQTTGFGPDCQHAQTGSISRLDFLKLFREYRGRYLHAIIFLSTRTVGPTSALEL